MTLDTLRGSSPKCRTQHRGTWGMMRGLSPALPGGGGLTTPLAGPERRWRVLMNEILLMGLVAIAVVVVMAGLLGWLVERDDLTA